MRYTKYICEKVPLSEPKFSQDLLLCGVALRQKVAKEWSALNGVEITPEMINCVGCRIDGVKTPYCDSLCPIRQCAMERGVETCGACADMSKCDKLGMITENNADALKNQKS